MTRSDLLVVGGRYDRAAAVGVDTHPSVASNSVLDNEALTLAQVQLRARMRARARFALHVLRSSCVRAAAAAGEQCIDVFSRAETVTATCAGCSRERSVDAAGKTAVGARVRGVGVVRTRRQRWGTRRWGHVCSLVQEVVVPRKHTKGIELWRLPPVLTVHLKRFQCVLPRLRWVALFTRRRRRRYNAYSQRKLTNLITFPLEVRPTRGGRGGGETLCACGVILVSHAMPAGA